jgi:PKD repeat protein
LHFWADAIPEGCGPGPLTFDWDFGDGTPHSSEQYPTHAYEYVSGVNHRTWTVTITAPGGTTCTEDGFVTPMSPTSQVNNFIAIPNKGYTPLTVTFYPVGYESQCPGTPYTWDFGDGTTSTEQNPTHTFVNPGPDWKYFEVRMTSWDYRDYSQSCGPNSALSTVQVLPPCGFIRCETTVPATARTGQSVHFEDLVTDDCPGDIGYLWNFGDGATSTEHKPYHTFAAAGTYSWEFRASFPRFGIECVKTGQIVVAGCTVTCTATVPDFSPVGSPAAFRATAQTTDCTGTTTYSWDFGDGTPPSTATNPDHTYTRAGKYTWKLTATNGSAKCEKTGTISVGCLTVGSLTFCADSIAQDGNTYTLTGSNTSINGLLWFSGSVTLNLDGPGASSGQLATAGAVFVKLSSHEEKLFEGPPTVTFEVDGGAGALIPTVDSTLPMAAKLAGLPLYATGTPITFGENSVTVKPLAYIGVAGIFTLASFEATVVYPAGGKKQLAGVQIVEGQVTPSIQFFTIQGTYDPDLDRFEGSVSVSFPFMGTWSASAAIRIQAGCFNGCDISVGLPEGIPLGTSGLELTGFTLKVDNICVPPQFTIFFGGDLGIVKVPGELFGISQVGLGYQQPWRMKIQAGNAHFLGYPLARLGGTLNALPDHEGASVQGNADIAGIYVADLNFSLSIPKLFLGGSASGSMQIPNFSCHWVNVPCRTLRRVITAAVTLPYTSYGVGMQYGLSGRTGTWNGNFRGNAEVAGYTLAMLMEYRQGEELSILVGTNFEDMYEVGRGEKISLGPEASEEPVTLATAQPLVLFAAAGESTIPTAYLKTPSGQTVTPANVGTFPGMSYIPGDEDTKTAVFRVENAAVGTWAVGSDNLTVGQVTFAALAPVPPPQASFTSVQQSGDAVNISLAVTPASPDTKVGIFFSQDAGASAGEPVALDLPATSGTVNATWDTATLATGSYYLFATVEDGKNPSVVVRHAQPVTVARGNLSGPTGLHGTRAGERANLAWTPSNSPSAAGYNILYTDTPEVPGFKEAVASTLPDRATVEGLDAEKTYRFAVQASDAQGNLSPESAPLTLEPAPAIPGDCDGSGAVSIGEVQKAINMFLGSIPPDCGVDCNGDGSVSIGEVQKVINGFLGVATSC